MELGTQAQYFVQVCLHAYMYMNTQPFFCCQSTDMRLYNIPNSTTVWRAALFSLPSPYNRIDPSRHPPKWIWLFIVTREKEREVGGAAQLKPSGFFGNGCGSCRAAASSCCFFLGWGGRGGGVVVHMYDVGPRKDKGKEGIASIPYKSAGIESGLSEHKDWGEACVRACVHYRVVEEEVTSI